MQSGQTPTLGASDAQALVATTCAPTASDSATRVCQGMAGRSTTSCLRLRDESAHVEGGKERRTASIASSVSSSQVRLPDRAPIDTSSRDIEGETKPLSEISMGRGAWSHLARHPGRRS
eukprot:scaffold884_cov322-Pavlova_lutheri.AAC.6